MAYRDLSHDDLVYNKAPRQPEKVIKVREAQEREQRAQEARSTGTSWREEM